MDLALGLHWAALKLQRTCNLLINRLLMIERPLVWYCAPCFSIFLYGCTTLRSDLIFEKCRISVWIWVVFTVSLLGFVWLRGKTSQTGQNVLNVAMSKICKAKFTAVVGKPLSLRPAVGNDDFKTKGTVSNVRDRPKLGIWVAELLFFIKERGQNIKIRAASSTNRSQASLYQSKMLALTAEAFCSILGLHTPLDRKTIKERVLRCTKLLDLYLKIQNVKKNASSNSCTAVQFSMRPEMVLRDLTKVQWLDIYFLPSKSIDKIAIRTRITCLSILQLFQ